MVFNPVNKIPNPRKIAPTFFVVSFFENITANAPQKTKKLTIGALLAAMGVALLFIGSFIETLDLSMAALASFFCLFAVIELGGIYPWLIYAVTGILSVILVQHSLGGWFYLLFFGFYPILKEKFDRLVKPLAWVIKIVIFNLTLILGTAVTFLLIFGQTEGKTLIDAFMYVFGGEEVGSWFAICVYLLANLTFVIYDFALTRLIVFYFRKIRDRLKFLK